jgi:hypothetical protein
LRERHAGRFGDLGEADLLDALFPSSMRNAATILSRSLPGAFAALGTAAPADFGADFDADLRAGLRAIMLAPDPAGHRRRRLILNVSRPLDSSKDREKPGKSPEKPCGKGRGGVERRSAG